jgi:isoamylase
MSEEEWDESYIRYMGMLLNGEYMNKKDIENGRQEEILLILVNSYWEPITFTLPSRRIKPRLGGAC